MKVFDTDVSTEMNEYISKFVIDLNVTSVATGVEQRGSFYKGSGRFVYVYKVRNIKHQHRSA